MPETPGPILEFSDVSLQYGDAWALRDISLTLNPGETRIILGAAGSGKTTLLKAVIGLVKPDAGDIKLFGEDVTSLKERELFRLRSRAGILFQEGGLFDSLSVGENVEYPLLNQQTRAAKKEASPLPHDHGSEAGTEPRASGDVESRVRDTLRFVELENTFDKFPSELSGGMRRRVGIARAIVTEPPLILYDSPTAGLDPITANLIMALIAKERDVRNTASLIVTHRYQDGELMANFRYDPERQELISLGAIEENDGDPHRTKFMVMKEGAIVFVGSLPELERSEDEYVKRFGKQEG